MAVTTEPLAPTADDGAPRHRPIRDALNVTGEIAAFMGASLWALPKSSRFASEALRQAAILIRTSTMTLLVMTGFIGFAVATFAFFFLSTAGGVDYMGFLTGTVGPRAAIPVMFGYVFSAKVGCGIVAEIGAAKINEEVDALEAEGVDPLAYVVGTRIVGALLFVPIAVAAALISYSAAVYIDGVVVLQGLPAGTLMNAHWAAQNIQDQLVAVLDLGTQAMAIVMVSCFFGYRASGGPAGVGRAVASSLVVNLVMIHVIVTFWVSLFYSQDPRLPIGG
ncbi:MAG: hypothetical protein JWN32_502 [Solirubrobacterales bacterium]|jgi:phospholipid/cholesterol/gamma-HCH transport system permease protein|nr:hypothetical protein [Solirubrobacterales bacterium]